MKRFAMLKEVVIKICHSIDVEVIFHNNTHPSNKFHLQ